MTKSKRLDEELGIERNPKTTRALSRSRLRSVSAKRASQRRARAAIKKRVIDRDRECQFRKLIGLPVESCFPSPYRDLEACHIVNESQGGPYTEDNLFAGCSYHNSLAESNAGFANLCREVGLKKRPDRTFEPYRRVVVE